MITTDVELDSLIIVIRNFVKSEGRWKEKAMRVMRRLEGDSETTAAFAEFISWFDESDHAA